MKNLSDEIILITGGTGFIGKHLARTLMKTGCRITLWSRKKIDLFEGISHVQVDLRDEKLVRERLCELNPTMIIHLASHINRGRDHLLVESMMQDNFSSSLHLFRASLELKNLKLLVNTGTCEEYGVNSTPFNEAQRESPVSAYGLSKICTTYLASYFSQIHQLPLVTVRPFLTYGPGQSEKMLIPFAIKKFLAGEVFETTAGEQTRDFVFVDDMVSGYITLLEHSSSFIGKVVNISSGKEVAIREVLLTLRDLINPRLEIPFGTMPYRKGENMHFYGSNERFCELSGWTPQIDLREGLQRTIAWYEQQD